MQQDLGKTVALIVSEINNAYQRDDCLALMWNLVDNPKRIDELQEGSG